MRYTLFILSALLVFVIPDQSQAQGKDPRVEIRPFVGMRLGGNVNDSGYEPVSGGEELIEDLNVKPGSQFGVMLNVPLALLGAYDPDNSWQRGLTKNEIRSVFKRVQRLIKRTQSGKMKMF